METVGPRNLICPETNEPCVSPNCTQNSCSERGRQDAEARQKEVVKESRLHHAKVSAVVKPLIDRLRLKEKRNSY
jgi:hypothetical protein